MAGAVFVLATDLGPEHAAWAQTQAQAAHLQNFAAKSLGVDAQVELARLPARAVEDPGELHIGRVIDRCIGPDTSVVVVLPAVFELNVWRRTMLGEELSAARRRHPAISFHHDGVDPTHPLLVECFAGQILQALEARHIPTQHAGLLLVADGQGDPATRADSYRLMRLLWEQAGLGWAEVGFVRHTQPFLPTVLKRCLGDPRAWVLVPQCQWDSELSDYAAVMLGDHQRAHPEAADWRLLDPPRDHPAVLAWIEQRLGRLWQDKRARQAVHVPSAKHQDSASPAGVWSGADWVPVSTADVQPRAGVLARAREPAPLAEILARVLPPAERYLVKVTWHGYATGTFTGARRLDLLLLALPGRAVLLEGHTSSRNVGGPDIDWEADSADHRTWIRQQDIEFLKRTGLADVIARHKAQYLNVTEAWWDGACAPAEEVQTALGEVALQNPELAGFVPSALLELRGTPMISFARFKGPTPAWWDRHQNLFRPDLLPHPLRTAWHGAGHNPLFAAVCCESRASTGACSPLFWTRGGLRLGLRAGRTARDCIADPLGKLRPGPHRRHLPHAEREGLVGARPPREPASGAGRDAEPSVLRARSLAPTWVAAHEEPVRK